MAKKTPAGSVMVKLSLIDPDPIQPRKTFDANKLGDLAASIRKHGILNPLIIEEAKGGRYILVDGERRYRAAKQVRLSEVPAVVNPAQTPTERLIQQFHLQEQHQGWSATEKAVAVAGLAKHMGYTIEQMAETLNLPRRTISDYVSFSSLIDKAAFSKNEVPIGYAKRIVGLRNYIKTLYMKQDKEFTQEMQKAFEQSVISRFKIGDITTQYDFAKLRDAFTSDYKAVEKFIKDTKVSTDSLFIGTNAKAASHARMLQYNANAMLTHARSLRALGGKKFLPDEAPVFASVVKELKALGVA